VHILIKLRGSIVAAYRAIGYLSASSSSVLDSTTAWTRRVAGVRLSVGASLLKAVAANLRYSTVSDPFISGGRQGAWLRRLLIIESPL
jgi:hypothetical protein